MIVEHLGERPRVHETAYVAPSGVVCGDVTIGPETRILFGAVVTAESGPVELGAHNIIMENAVLRGVSRQPLRIGDHVLIGPHAHLTGCEVTDDVFIATGAVVFNGAHIEGPSEVRVNATVHVTTWLPGGSTVPIGWVAVGDPAQLFPPDRHEDIWAVQQQMNFPGKVFGVDRAGQGSSRMPEITERYARALARYADAVVLDQ
jgi:carbonic anhydrase/acetyltransferase-like protein (isoleucine patch superfamily)